MYRKVVFQPQLLKVQASYGVTPRLKGHKYPLHFTKQPEISAHGFCCVRWPTAKYSGVLEWFFSRRISLRLGVFFPGSNDAFTSQKNSKQADKIPNF
jgi:hypothetical protein